MNGFYNVLKSTSMTSSDVVVILRGILRRITGERLKVGHLGTLDPGGAGVLPIAVGSAVKLFDYMLSHVKVYRAEFVFGLTTDTLDSYGAVTDRGAQVTDPDEVILAARSLVGTYGQIPPLYSAKSVDGQRAYDLARKGVDVALKPREVTVYDIALVSHDGNRFTFDITCSAGTYIRSLARDMAAKLGTVGYMSYIIRMRSGDFTLEGAATLDEIKKDIDSGFCPLERFAATLEDIAIPEDKRAAVQNGVVYPITGEEKVLRRIVIGGVPYAVGTIEAGRLKVICKL